MTSSRLPPDRLKSLAKLKYEKMEKTALDRYEEIVTDTLSYCTAKLRKSFKSAFILVMILYMVIPRKINFTQMGRYSDSCEQRFRQLFEHIVDVERWTG